MTIPPSSWAKIYTGFDNHVRPVEPVSKTPPSTEQYITRLRFQQLVADYQADRASFLRHYHIGKYIDIMV